MTGFPSVGRSLHKWRFEALRQAHLFWLDMILAKKSRQGTREFQCNICGEKASAPMVDICQRDNVSCHSCGSTLRYRSLIHLLSISLFGESKVLPDFPVRKDVAGIGMSDWPGYAGTLAEKLNYTNTFYHKEPRLDICSISPGDQHKYDFIISSDVFEHVLAPVSRAFSNAEKLLKPGGVFLMTVPFMLFVKTWEHFPELEHFELVDENGKKILINNTVDGRRQVFDDLVFHGGHGATLELRIFSRSDLDEEFGRAGFHDIHFHKINYPEFGIVWPIAWSLPMTARAQS